MRERVPDGEVEGGGTGQRRVPSCAKGAWVPHRSLGLLGPVGAWSRQRCARSSGLQGGRRGGPEKATRTGEGKPRVWRRPRGGGGAAPFGPNTDRTPPTGHSLDAGGGCPFLPPASVSPEPPPALWSLSAENGGKVRGQPPCEEERPSSAAPPRATLTPAPRL